MRLKPNLMMLACMGVAMVLLGAYMFGLSLNVKIPVIVAGVGGFFAILGGLLALYEPVRRFYWSLKTPPIRVPDEGLFVVGRCKRCGENVAESEKYCVDCGQFLKQLSRL